MRTKVSLLLWLPPPLSSTADTKTTHLFVALCDHAHQGIVPVPALPGNGQDPKNNLYWGAQLGGQTFFDRSRHGQPLHRETPQAGPVLQRKVYRHKASQFVLVANAYDRRPIQAAIRPFPRAGNGNADGMAYIGRNGSMDFTVDAPTARPADHKGPAAIVLACNSQAYFIGPLKKLNCQPVLLTTGFTAPGPTTSTSRAACAQPGGCFMRSEAECIS